MTIADGAIASASRNPAGTRQLGLLGLSVAAVAIGLVTGLGAIVLRSLMALFHNIFFLGEFSFVYNANVATPPSPFGPFIILAPVLGGLMVLFLVRNYAPEAKGHGVPEVMDAIYYGGGRIRPAVVLIKSLASALSIGSGASVGREGPIIQIGAGIGSVIGQRWKLQRWQILTMVAAGAGAGIAATFNTPLGAVLFAVELMLPELSARTLMPVALATGTATYVGRLAFGIDPAFLVTIPETPDVFVPLAVDVLPLYVVVGLICGIVAVLFIRTLYATEDLFESVPINPYLKTAIGMGAVGALLYALMATTGVYHTAGVGYSTIQGILNGEILGFWFLLLLFVLKLLATSVSLGAGTSGGVFSPSLFIGAALGGAMGVGLDTLFPAAGFSPVSFALIGMAGIVGASTGAALTSVLMIFEMTGDYAITLPAIIAVAVAVGVRRGIMTDNIYTMKLTRRGHHIPRETRAHMFLLHKVGDVMEPVIGTVEQAEMKPFEKVHLRAEGKRNFAVVMDGRQLVGVVAVEPDAPDQSQGPVLEPVGIVRESSFLREAIGEMSDRGHLALLVMPDGVSPQPEHAVGVVTRIALADSVLQDYRS